MSECCDEEVPCICTEWDGRGRSVCGLECPAHPIDGKCPDCDKATHANVHCFACFAKGIEASKTWAQKQIDKGYRSAIDAMHAAEALSTTAPFRQDELQWHDAESRAFTEQLAKDARKVFEGMCALYAHYRRCAPNEYVWGD